MIKNKMALGLTLSCYMLLFSCQDKSVTVESEKEAVKQTLISMWDAIENEDINAYASLIHPDFTQFGEYDSILRVGKIAEVAEELVEKVDNQLGDVVYKLGDKLDKLGAAAAHKIKQAHVDNYVAAFERARDGAMEAIAKAMEQPQQEFQQQHKHPIKHHRLRLQRHQMHPINWLFVWWTSRSWCSKL